MEEDVEGDLTDRDNVWDDIDWDYHEDEDTRGDDHKNRNHDDDNDLGDGIGDLYGEVVCGIECRDYSSDLYFIDCDLDEEALGLGDVEMKTAKRDGTPAKVRSASVDGMDGKGNGMEMYELIEIGDIGRREEMWKGELWRKEKIMMWVVFGVLIVLVALMVLIRETSLLY
jgi:hypothetical protein